MHFLRANQVQFIVLKIKNAYFPSNYLTIFKL